MSQMKVCSTDGCGAHQYSKGMCQTHYNADYGRRNREKLLKRAREYRQNNLEQVRAYDRQRASNPEAKERKRQYDAQYRLRNRERYLAYERQRSTGKAEYRKRERGRYNSLAAKRRANLRHATPPWVNHDDLRAIYVNCPHDHEVDHIVPLTNPRVCGLHVPWNLQYLPGTENQVKSNKLLLDVAFYGGTYIPNEVIQTNQGTEARTSPDTRGEGEESSRG